MPVSGGAGIRQSRRSDAKVWRAKITHQHVFDKYVTLPDTRNILHLGRFPGWTHQNAHCPYRFNLYIIEPVAARMISVPLSGKKTT